MDICCVLIQHVFVQCGILFMSNTWTFLCGDPACICTQCGESLTIQHILVKCLHNDIEHVMIHLHGMLCVILEGDCSTFWHSRMAQSLPGVLNIHSADAVFINPYDLPFCVTGPYKTLHSHIIFKQTCLFCLEVGLQSACQCSL
jgi:hypothetical protein